ncbi:Transporter, CPA2 family [Candidatus Terasakiella magnetica]|uniref:Transporter, CPA2 family n=1 Tax=Candidatus Terasakiella magnetica TaxID=1867952 RepID=A0A1C3RFA4_9PROT|nr:cation:proton antiporter family protein [Candidatus Terasakiella magnetica]SCA55973.1 Transporter, CPA2 family [Candidatus Terasakiella magnetica]
MDSLLSAIDYQDPAWIAIAFIFGLMFQQFKLPPMVGFLLAGFMLHLLGVQQDSFLTEIADLGVTLLLFTIGLKLDLKSLLKPEIWATTLSHMGISVLVGIVFILGLGGVGISIFSGIDLATTAILAFALSFSSTVFAVKTLEDRGALSSRYGQIAIGVLVMQDIAAVTFLALSTGKVPSIWALSLFLLIPGRHILAKALELSGHKELLTIFGFSMALGGAAVFELVGMKGDLGALVIGILLGTSKKSNELAHTLLGFKDVFLVCFFLTIGLTGLPTFETFGAAALLLLLIPLKVFLFYLLFTRFRLRARGSTLATLSLANYSEFGLIVTAIAISSGMLESQWLTVVALALSASFVIASPFSYLADKFYTRYRHILKSFETKSRLKGDENINIAQNSILIFGMGRVGRAAYDEMKETSADNILGIDQDPIEVERLTKTGRSIIYGDATNPEFWSRIDHGHPCVELILLAMPNSSSNIMAAKQLRAKNYQGPIVAITKYEDEYSELEAAGVNETYNIYAEAGSGAASKMQSLFRPD